MYLPNSIIALFYISCLFVSWMSLSSSHCHDFEKLNFPLNHALNSMKHLQNRTWFQSWLVALLFLIDFISNQSYFRYLHLLLQFSFYLFSLFFLPSTWVLIFRIMWPIIFLSFSDLNMLADSEGTDHLDFQEHSKGEPQYFCNSNPNMQLLFLTFSPPLSLLSQYFHINFLDSRLFIYNSLFSQVQPCVTCGLFPVSVCITLGTLNCSQNSYHTVKPWYPTWSCTCSLFLLNGKWPRS